MEGEQTNLILEETQKSELQMMREKALAPYPWRRYLAKTMDILFYGMIWDYAAMYVLRWNNQTGSGGQLISMFINLVLMVMIEPALLASVGTTPGKWIFGLVLRDKNGQKIKYVDGLSRSFELFKRGYGYGIPIYNLYRLYKSYVTCKDKELSDWEPGYTYYIKEHNHWRTVGYIGITILAVGASVILTVQATLPIHRGNITEEEYYDNCNDFMKYFKVNMGKHINSEGQWVDDGDSSFVLFIDTVLPTQEIIMENGRIKKVIMDIETNSGHARFSGYSEQVLMAYYAFVGAQKESNGFNLFKKEYVEIMKNSNEDYTFEVNGIKVTCDVEMKGYEEVSGSYLVPKEEEEQYYHMVFVMEKL